jgi:hypothetical protein
MGNTTDRGERSSAMNHIALALKCISPGPSREKLLTIESIADLNDLFKDLVLADKCVEKLSQS